MQESIPPTNLPIARDDRWHLWQRVLCFLAGVVWPIVCFGMAWNGPVMPPRWQSGQRSDYAILMLGGAAAWVFAPLLLYAMSCLTLLTYRFERFAAVAAVRLGLYFGVLLATHFLVLYWLRFGLLDSWEGAAWAGVWTLACVATLGFFKFLGWVHRKAGGKRLAAGVGVLLLLYYAFHILQSEQLSWSLLTEPFLGAFFLGLITAPCITLIAFAATAWRVVRSRRGEPWRFSLIQALGVTTGLAVYLGTVRWSIRLAMLEYAKLPTAPTERCYVATAASQGHPWFVRSYETQCGDGSRRRVNTQLRRLKLFEIALATVAPKWHRRLRHAYDRAGPFVASLLRRPMAADLAYLTLKPIEYAALVALRIAAPDCRTIDLYPPRRTTEGSGCRSDE